MKCAVGVLACAALASAQSLGTVLMSNMTTELASLIKGVPGLMDQLAMAKDVTILAPTNKAVMDFAKHHKDCVADPTMVSNLLMYHVLNGTIKAADIMATVDPMFPHTMLTNMTMEQVEDGQYVMAQAMDKKVIFTSGLMKDATVTTPDIMFDGGVVHMIDKVLTVPKNISDSMVRAGLTKLADTAMKANLVDTLTSMENMTVFAPSNKAFDAVSSMMGGSKLMMSNSSIMDVSKILTYHVVKNSVLFSTDLMNGAMIPTVNGGDITVHKVGTNWFVNDAMITKPNMLVANGVVHEIDSVLNPNNTSASPMPTATAGSAEFGAADSSDTSSSTTDGSMMSSTTMPGGAHPTGNGTMPAKGSGGAAAVNAVPYLGAVALGAALFL